MEDPAFCCYALAVVALAANMIATAQLTGLIRVLTSSYLAPEDFIVTSAQHERPEVVQQFGTPTLKTLSQLHRNSLENIPIFLFLALVWVASDPPLWELRLVLGLYCATRYVFSYAYFYRLQPLRTYIFVLGLLLLMYVMGSVVEALLPQLMRGVRFLFLLPSSIQMVVYEIKFVRNKAEEDAAKAG